MPSPTSVQALDGRRSRADEIDPPQVGPNPPHRLLGRASRQLLVGTADHDIHHAYVGRVGRLLPLGELSRRKRLEVVPHGRTDRIVVGERGLDEYLTPERAPPRSTGNLGEELKGALAGPEVGQVHADVRVDRADQRDSGRPR